jgi:hypothetical protein
MMAEKYMHVQILLLCNTNNIRSYVLLGVIDLLDEMYEFLRGRGGSGGEWERGVKGERGRGAEG